MKISEYTAALEEIRESVISLINQCEDEDKSDAAVALGEVLDSLNSISFRHQSHAASAEDDGEESPDGD